MMMWNDYEKIARRLDRIANAFERIADALETANIIEADCKTEPQTDGYMTAEQAEDYRKMLDKAEHKVYGNIEDEPQKMCDANCNEDCTECAKEWQDWKDQMWTEAVIEPQTDNEIVLDPSFAELSDEQFAEAMKLIEPQTDCSWK